MRSIKFRIWDKKHKRWFQGSTKPEDIARQTDSISLFGEVILMGSLLRDQHEDDVWKNDPDVKSSLDILDYLEVCQYTGLKDRNGKDIYEGDIVRWADDYDENAYISFDEGCFWVNWPINSERINGEMADDFEVIGNIHENPELSRVEK